MLCYCTTPYKIDWNFQDERQIVSRAGISSISWPKILKQATAKLFSMVCCLVSLDNVITSLSVGSHDGKLAT